MEKDWILKNGPFVLADRTIQTFSFAGKKEYVKRAFPEDVGRYCTNQEALAVVDSQRRYWVSENNLRIIKILEEYGYKEGDFHVPHSSDGGRTLKKMLLENECQMM